MGGGVEIWNHRNHPQYSNGIINGINAIKVCQSDRKKDKVTYTIYDYDRQSWQRQGDNDK